MNKIIFIVSIVTLISGIVGFYTSTPFTTFLRIVFLISADVLIIMLLAKLLFAGNRALRSKGRNKSIRTS
ncbi:DUF1328 domain-containing protein [Nonlabens sp.]|uniref:DUF1328 domain-containing protein n=1 Tax=Nonlabens sp. TaxID=1888209 RepID=UPI0032670C8C